jgi:hypothetical protein
LCADPDAKLSLSLNPPNIDHVLKVSHLEGLDLELDFQKTSVFLQKNNRNVLLLFPITSNIIPMQDSFMQNGRQKAVFCTISEILFHYLLSIRAIFYPKVAQLHQNHLKLSKSSSKDMQLFEYDRQHTCLTLSCFIGIVFNI